MGKKKYLFLLVCIPAVIAAIYFVWNGTPFGLAENRADATNYSIKFNSSTNKVSNSSGTLNVNTNINNIIKFNYNGLSNNSSGWMNMSNGGYIRNDFIARQASYPNDLNGLSSITVNYSGSGKLSVGYGWFETNKTNKQITSGVPFDFDGMNPSHFSIFNESGGTISITSITVNYSCQDSGMPTNLKEQGIYNIEIDSFTSNSLSDAYSRALKLSNDQLKGYDTIQINFPSNQEFITEDAITLSGYRRNNRKIVLNGNGSTINNGVALTTGGWSEYSNGIYVKDVGIREKFSTLLVNGEAADLARTSTIQGYKYDDESRELRVEKTAVSNIGLSSLPNDMLVMLEERWAGCTARVTSVVEDYYKKKSYSSKTYTWDMSFDTIGQYVMFDSNRNYRDVDTPYFSFADNLMFLDTNNEYYYDKTTGKLYYKPADASTINTSTFIIPTAETLFDTSLLADNVTVKNFKFNGSAYNTHIVTGYHDCQSTVNNILTNSYHSEFVLPGLINIASTNFSLENCVINDAACTGIQITSAAAKVRVFGNTIKKSNGCGVFIGCLGNKDKYSIPTNIEIVNNVVDTYGRQFCGATGINALYVNKLDISHNTIHDGKYSGITVGWGWCTNRPDCGHREYKITYNNIYEVNRSKLYDGACIYTLGAFMNEPGEMFNEIAYNYLEYKRGLGVIYLDESSSSWHVHHNALKVAANEDSKLAGTIFNHNPIENSYEYYTVCHSNKFDTNYVIGSSLGYTTHTYYWVTTDGHNAYEHFDTASYNSYCSTHNISYENPTVTTATHANEEIYTASGASIVDHSIFSNSSTFTTSIYNTDSSTLRLDSANNKASFKCGNGGFSFAGWYLKSLFDLGYSYLNFSVKASIVDTSKTLGSFVIYKGNGWQEYNAVKEATSSDFVNFMVDLSYFSLGNSNLIVSPRTAGGLSGEFDFASNCELRNVFVSKIAPTCESKTELVNSTDDSYEYQVSNLSYNWKRITISNVNDLLEQGYDRLTISSLGNNHNLYAFQGDAEYTHCLKARGGYTSIDLSGNNPVYIMTCHEDYDLNQDESGTFGTSESFKLCIKLEKSAEGEFASMNSIRKYFTNLVFHDFDDATGTGAVSCAATFIVNTAFFDYCRAVNASGFSFDIVPESGSATTSLVTIYRYNDNSGQYTADYGSFSYPARFDLSGGVIHVSFTFNSSTYKLASTRQIDFVCRNNDGYNTSTNQTLDHATFKNLRVF